MSNYLLPHAIPIATAALIKGVSTTSFRQYVIEPQLVEKDARGRIVLASLEKHIGRPINSEMVLAAERKRDAAREWQAAYRKRTNCLTNDGEQFLAAMAEFEPFVAVAAALQDLSKQSRPIRLAALHYVVATLGENDPGFVQAAATALRKIRR